MADTLQNYADTLRNQTRAIEEDLTPKEKLKEKLDDTFGSIGETLAVDSGEGLVKTVAEKVKDTLEKKGGDVGKAVGTILTKTKEDGLKGGLKETLSQIGSRVGRQPAPSVQPRRISEGLRKAPKEQKFNNPAFETYEDSERLALKSKIDKLLPSQESVEALRTAKPVEEDIASGTLSKVKSIALGGDTEPGGSLLGRLFGGGGGAKPKPLSSEIPSGVGKSEIPKEIKPAVTEVKEGLEDEGKGLLKKALKTGGKDLLKTEAGESEIGGFLDPVADIVGLGVGLGGLLHSLFHKPPAPEIQHINSSFQIGV